MARRGPQKAHSVFAELRIFHTADPQTNMNRAVHAAGYLGEAKEAAQRYRAAVLAHPDLSKQLCEIFGYPSAEAWTGFVPSRLTADDKYNPSPHRAALVPIVAEALDRAGDYRAYDEERLGRVPPDAIREPWRDTPESIAAKAAAARLQALMVEDEEG